jgi:hypothetical protein
VLGDVVVSACRSDAPVLFDVCLSLPNPCLSLADARCAPGACARADIAWSACRSGDVCVFPDACSSFADACVAFLTVGFALAFVCVPADTSMLAAAARASAATPSNTTAKVATRPAHSHLVRSPARTRVDANISEPNVVVKALGI